MPVAAPVACSQPGCPDLAIERGRCARHRRTTSERGYGRDHQLERLAALPGARCEGCGCTANLQRDHRIPASLGGPEIRSNKRWLCSCVEHGCHARLGLRLTSRALRA